MAASELLSSVTFSPKLITALVSISVPGTVPAAVFSAEASMVRLPPDTVATKLLSKSTLPDALNTRLAPVCSKLLPPVMALPSTVS